MPELNLSPDELLTTTRTVRKRLDFTRPVEPEILRECLEIAVQAPTGSNRQNWQFVFVTDAAKKLAIADLYRRGFTAYRNDPAAIANMQTLSEEQRKIQNRVVSSSDYLAEHMHEVPVMFIPCFKGRLDGKASVMQASMWGSIMPAIWSFMLAARARGLGTAWTTLHLPFEKEAAEVLGIPYEKVTQVALVPVAYTKGTDFKPAPRRDLTSLIHWNQW